MRVIILNKDNTRKWFHKLKFKLTLIHFILLALLITSTILILFYAQKEFLHKESLRNNKKQGQSLVAELSQRLSKTEALAKSLARVAETLEPEQDLFKRVIPPIINFNDEQSIAGGGVWPEPYLFHKEKERRSFFWGRESNGKLKYYDDYNDPNGSGYHHEEWYVPARFLKHNQVYWSQSYIDIYSGEPMVTCTAPMYKNGNFYGVTTIDLKLRGLDHLLAKKAKTVNGYIFALDRNNKLLSYPDYTIAKSKESSQSKFAEFHHLKKLAQKFDNYKVIQNEIQSFLNSVQSDDFSILEQARSIDKESHQINAEQARLIATMANTQKLSWSSQKVATKDPLLQTDVLYTTVFMPRSSWKVIIASPLSEIKGFSNKVTYSILLIMIPLELAILFIMFSITNKAIIRPISTMSHKLSHSTINDTVQLNATSPDEIGQLAYEFNKRSKVIAENLAEIHKQNDELEHSKKIAETASRSKSTFLANMSHEIRTPLTAIIGYANYIIEHEVDKTELYNNLGVIKNNGEHLLEIINDILDLSKIEADKLEVIEQDCPLSDIITDCQSISQLQNSNKNIELKFTPSYPLPKTIKTDRVKLRQIILNLLSNANKFTESGSIELAISYEESENSLIIQVKDTGIGMTAEQQQKVFEAFEQADSNITRRYGGTGLGMKISYQLAQLLGGQLSVESELGIGSNFTLVLKLKSIVSLTQEPHTPTLPQKKTELLTESFQGKLLLVEDNRTNQKLISKILRKKGLDVEIACDGYEGLKQVQNNSFDLVLMDLQMPNMDGITATSKIRSFNTTTPIIAITANAFESDRQNCIDAGFNDFLTKPIKQDVLWSTLAKHLHK